MKKVVGALIFNDKDEVLLCRKASLPYYIFPGGKPEEGDEDDIGTLKREIKEELQCESYGFNLFNTYKGTKSPKGDKLEVVMYTAKLKGEPTIGSEIVELVWHKSRTFLKYPMTTTTINVLLDLHKVMYNKQSM